MNSTTDRRFANMLISIFSKNHTKNVTNRYVYNMQSYSAFSYHISQTGAQSYSPNCRCSCHKSNGVLFRLRLAKLSITFLKKENDKEVKESVDEGK